jgi:hypothetical protein
VPVSDTWQRDYRQVRALQRLGRMLIDLRRLLVSGDYFRKWLIAVSE